MENKEYGLMCWVFDNTEKWSEMTLEERKEFIKNWSVK